MVQQYQGRCPACSMQYKTVASNLQPVPKKKKTCLTKITRLKSYSICLREQQRDSVSNTLIIDLQHLLKEKIKIKNAFKYISYKTMVWLSSLPISRLSDRWMPDSCQFLGMWEKMLSAARVAGCSPIFVHNFGSLLSVKKQATLFIPPFVASVQEEKALLATVSARVTYKRYKNIFFFFFSLAATSLLQSRQNTA